ncbi:hypothetical protein OJ998_36935 [Solirubrobacter taibaiensis]|nr:hypothetical protein [Solirubrobacter taibaiensis]
MSDSVSDLLDQALDLDDNGREVEAFPLWDEVITAVGDATDDELRELAGRAWLRKAWALSALGRRDEAVVEYAAAAARFPDIAWVAEYALAEVAHHAHEQGRPQEALDVLAGLPRDVYNALVEGHALADLGRDEAALACFDALVADFAEDPDLLTHVTSARARKVEMLQDLRRRDECIATCRELVTAASGSPDPYLRNEVANAFAAAAAAHANEGRTRAALTLYRQFRREFRRGESDRIDQLLEWTDESIALIWCARVRKCLFWGGLAVVLAREVISSKRQ